MARYREHPGEGAFNEHGGLDFVRQKPAELNAPLAFVRFLEDLLRTGELFIASHLVYACAEGFGRKRSKARKQEAFGLVFATGQDADGGPGADRASGTPPRAWFRGAQQHAA